MSIRAKLISVMATLAAMLLLVVGVATLGLTTLRVDLNEVVSSNVFPMKELKSVSDAYAVDVVDAAHKARNGGLSFTEALKRVTAAKQEIARAMSALRSAALDAEDRELMRQLTGLTPAADAVVEKLHLALRSGDKMAVDALVTGAMYPAIDPVTDMIGKLVDLQLVQAQNAYAIGADHANQAVTAAVIAAILGVICLIIGFWTAIGGVTHPLAEITQVMTRVAEGRLEETIPRLEQRDEIGGLARALAVFRDGAVERLRLESEAAKRQAQAEADRRAAILTMADRLDSSVSRIAHDLAGAADGLAARASDMSRIAADGAQRAAAVAHASAEASSNVESVAGATEEMSMSIRDVARQTGSARNVSDKAVAEAQEANETVRGLAAAAAKIGDVVRLINDIAGQTNLLALNATIEAARAGEAGRGFAVVASEVKTLAGQTAKATEEIQTQVAAIQAETARAVEAIGEVSHAIGDVNAFTLAIAAAVEQQDAATAEIGRNVHGAAQGASAVSANAAAVLNGAEQTQIGAADVQAAAAQLQQQSQALQAELRRFLSGVRG